MKEPFVSDDTISECYLIMAEIVAKYGDEYLPLFERIHNEVQLRKANSDLKSLALQMVRNQIK